MMDENNVRKFVRLYTYLSESAEYECVCGREEGQSVRNDEICAHCLIKDTAAVLVKEGILPKAAS